MNNKSIFGRLALMAVAVLSTVACTVNPPLTEQPVPTNFSQEAMYKLSSVSHWNNVAADMARDVATKYGAGKGCIPGMGCQASLYVKPQDIETSFSQAFRTQLISALVNQGLPVVTRPQSNSTIVEIDIQVVATPGGKAAVEYDHDPVELVEGVWVIKDVNDTAVKKFTNTQAEQWTQGKARRAPWFRSPHFVPAAEMLVSVSFINNERYMARTSNVYYLNSVTGYVVPPPPVAVEVKRTAWPVRLVGDCTAARCEVK